jgi:hypothetical protein
MVNHSKCLICEKNLVWVEELLSYLPVPTDCKRHNCPYIDNSEIDLEDANATNEA